MRKSTPEKMGREIYHILHRTKIDGINLDITDDDSSFDSEEDDDTIHNAGNVEEEEERPNESKAENPDAAKNDGHEIATSS